MKTRSRAALVALLMVGVSFFTILQPAYAGIPENGWRLPAGTSYSVSTGFLANECGHPEYGGYIAGKYHTGNDLGNASGITEGTNVYAIGAGTVIAISTSGWSWGTPGHTNDNVAVMIRHTASDGSKFVALYGHIVKSANIQVNTVVAKGTKIGDVGYYGPGNAHLHFGIHPGSSVPTGSLGTGVCPETWPPSANGFVNPMPYLNAHPVEEVSTTDSDNDGVIDSADWCALVEGVANNRGCPNTVRQISGDLDGDGKGDIIAISRASDNAPRINWFRSISGENAELADPVGILSLPAPAWNVDHLKWVAGDFNGDGKDDLFAASGTGYGYVNMYMLLSSGSGFANPILVKQPPHPSWQWSRLEFLAADFDGDGKDDIFAISRGSDNSPYIHVFRSTSDETDPSLADPSPLKDMPAPAWNVDHLKWVAGDFDGDGKEDLFAASGSQDHGPNMYIFRSTGTTLADPILVKQPNPAQWLWDRLVFMKAGIDGDDKDDILAISRASDNSPYIHVFRSTSDGTSLSLADPSLLRDMPAPAWNVSNLKFAVVDHNGDGRDDLFAASGNQQGVVNMYLFTATTSGSLPTLDVPEFVKQPNPAQWIWWRLQF